MEKISAKLKHVKGKVRLHGVAARAKRARPPRVLAYISGYIFEFRTDFFKKKKIEKISADPSGVMWRVRATSVSPSLSLPPERNIPPRLALCAEVGCEDRVLNIHARIKNPKIGSLKIRF